MKRSSSIMSIWAAIILIWTCCLFITCLFLSDVICSEEELCDRINENTFSRNEIDADGDAKQRSILLFRKHRKSSWILPRGDYIFRYSLCPVTACFLTYDVTEQRTAYAIILDATDIRSRDDLPAAKERNQLWILMMTRPPDHKQGDLSVLNDLVNWTSTYSAVSDIPRPFGVYRMYNVNTNKLQSEWEPTAPRWRPKRSDSSWANSFNKTIANQRYGNISFLSRRNKLVAMFTEECQLTADQRYYVEELRKHVDVDIYGNCQDNYCGSRNQCVKMLRTKYKFYLAFEDSRCHQYITDQFWHIALGNDMIPVVMGPPRSDYQQVAPPKSFIHVDDFESPASLASYLVHIDSNASAYMEYFQWKTRGYIKHSIRLNKDHHFWCDLCARLHNKSIINTDKVYSDLEKWWSYDREC